jgi:hypothetical protein
MGSKEGDDEEVMGEVVGARVMGPKEGDDEEGLLKKQQNMNKLE